MIANGIRLSTASMACMTGRTSAAASVSPRHGAYVTVWLIYTLASGYRMYYPQGEGVSASWTPMRSSSRPERVATPDRASGVGGPGDRRDHAGVPHPLPDGPGPAATLEAARRADVLTTSIARLPTECSSATQTIVRNLRSMGLACDVDLPLVEEIGRHFARVAAREGKPVGVPAEYDLFHYQHQTAGGVLSNLESQLREVGAGHRLAEVLEECARVREDLGWPIIVTPFAQFVGTQAALNVLQGERYVVPTK